MFNSNSLDDIDPDLNYDFFSDSSSTSCEYYNLREYLDLSGFDKFTLLNHNIRSFNRNIDCLLACFPDENLPSILCLTETRFSINRVGNINNYDGHHTIRNSETPSGGVSIFTSCRLEAHSVEMLSFCNDTIEVCTVETCIGDLSILIIGIYRPHSDSIENFNDALSVLLNNNLVKNKFCVLMGDLNICLLREMDANQSFINLMFTNHFLPLISKATRFSPILNESPSLLDHIWLNKFTPHSAGILDIDITDHLPTFLHLTMKNSNTNEKTRIQFRENNPTNQSVFKSLLSNYDWASCISTNADIYYDNFATALNSLYCTAFPIKTKYVSARHAANTWMTPTLRKLIYAKSDYFKLYKLNMVDVSENNRYRNKVNSIIRKQKIKYYQTLFLKYKNNMKATWNLINNILSKNRQKSSIKKIIVNNVIYSEEADVANIFNDFFCSVGPQIEAGIPQSFTDPLEHVVNSNPNSFFLHPVSPLEVSYYLKNLKNSKQNIDSISISVLKENADSFISSVLTDVINTCFFTGVFPSNLKKAIVIPLYKKGERDQISNYRPISILPTFSKIFEKCIKSRLVNYFVENNIFNPTQFGFRENVSTQDAIVFVMEKIYENLNDKKSTLSVFIDFSKCFDVLNRGILARKLDAYGIRGIALDLIVSYLGGRLQAVRMGNFLSDFKENEHGVTQGSVLGPLLFLIYVNELPLISNLFSACLFADDTTLIFENRGEADLVSCCNRGLELFSNWCCANRLSINCAKTNYMLFSNVMNSESIIDNIRLNNSVVHYASSVRFLGLEIDEKMKFNLHIKNVTNKISKNSGILYKMRQFIPLNTLLSLYYSFIESHLNYCPLIFGNSYSTHLRPLEVAQRRCIRIITNQHPQAHADPIFENLKLLKFEKIYKLHLGTYMYKNLDKFGANLQSHNYLTRSGSNFYTPTFQRLSLTQNQSLYFQVPNNWNIIPDDIKNSTSFNVFKRKYKNFLLTNN